jgi:predicted phosphodiesterase
VAVLRFGVLTDVHFAPEGSAASWHNAYDFAGVGDRVRGAIQLFADEGVDGVVFAGDLTHREDEASVAEGLEHLQLAPGNLWLARGNHDSTLDRGAHGGSAGGERLAEDVRLAVVDIATDDGGATFRSAATLPADSWGDELAVVVSHYPLISRAAHVSAVGLPYPGDLVGRAPLLDALLDRVAPSVVLSGHLHVRDSTAQGPVLQLLFAAVVEYPFECSLLELGEGRVTRTAIPLQDAPHRRDPVLVPPLEEWEFDGRWHRTGP